MSHNGKSWHKPLATERYDTVQVATERVSPERNKEEPEDYTHALSFVRTQ